MSRFALREFSAGMRPPVVYPQEYPERPVGCPTGQMLCPEDGPIRGAMRSQLFLLGPGPLGRHLGPADARRASRL